MLAARRLDMRTSFACVVMLASAGCASSDEQELAAARAGWTDHHQQHYVFTWHRTCFCEDTRPAAIEVLNGAIVNATYADDHTVVVDPIRRTLPTIDGVFDTVQDAIESDPDRLRIEYDPTWGFPSSVFVDYDQHAQDEELSFQLSEFAPITK
jgi:hypothetical protein